MSNEPITCELCGASAIITVAGYPGYQRPDLFDIGWCGSCCTSFVLERSQETHALYDAIYRQVEMVPGYSRYARYASDVLSTSAPLDYLADSELTYWAVRKHLRATSNKDVTRVIEIGSGLGYLTYALNQAGYDARGLDISSKAVESATERYGPHYLCSDLAAYAEQESGQYDYAIMTELIEHVAAPIPMLEAALRLVRPGGHVLITTPNRDLWPPTVPWEVDRPPVHLWWFSRLSMETIGRRLGCEVHIVNLEDFPGRGEWLQPREPHVLLPILHPSGKLIRREMRHRLAGIARGDESVRDWLRDLRVRIDERRATRVIDATARVRPVSPTLCATFTRE